MKRIVVTDKLKYNFFFLSIAGLLFLWLFKATTEITPVQADTIIVVTTTEDELNDDTDCSLREAIRAANTNSTVSGCPAGSGADTIILPSGVYTLTMIGIYEDAALTGDLDIIGDLTISGENMDTTVVDGNGSVTGDRVFHITDTSSVIISNLTVQNGNTGGGANGGGILNYGTLTLTNSTLSNNAAAHGAGMLNVGTATLISSTVTHNIAFDDGGGIRNDVTLMIVDSTIDHNEATHGSGGGIENHGISTLRNSTVSSNLADDFGGGIYNGYAPLSQGSTLSLNNTTITQNVADTDADEWGGGGGVHTVSISTVNIKNTILAGNMGPAGSPDCSGTLNSQGYNLIQSTTGCNIGGDAVGNIIGSAANLGPLEDSGGSTLTHALLTSSPAINAGNPAIPGSGAGACEATDQRGITRPQGIRCDIGAFELDSKLVYLPLIQR